MLETSLFYLISAGMVASAVGVVTSRSAVYSVLFLVGSMGFLAGLFVLLKAFLVATLLILVYAGAILVLFLFVVMLTDVPVSGRGLPGLTMPPVLALGLGLAVFLQAFRVIRTVDLPPQAAVYGTAKAVGGLLFRDYLLPFELTSFLLLAAVVSVVVLAKKEPR